MLKLRKLALLGICAGLLLWACATAPITGRSQFKLLTDSQESALGLEAYNEVKATSKMSTNAAWKGMVERSGRRIAAVASRPDFQWEFNLIADDTINAFCLPGGKVAFYEGIMPVCQDEAGVAVVMGHEIAHAIAGHGNERVSQGMLTQGITSVSAEFLGGNSPGSKELIAKGIGAGLNLGLILPFSREHESEADHIGIILMAKAGYDPREAPRFWERMEAKASGGRSPEFLSTHPNPSTRITQLKNWMPEAMQYYDTSKAR